MPDVRPNAVEHFEKLAEKNDAENNETKKKTEKPEQITLNKDGTPAKKRGRKPGQVAKQQSFIAEKPAVSTKNIETPAPLFVGEKHRQTGEVSAHLFVTVAQLVGGEEFAAESDEKAILAESFSRYYAVKNIEDIPPGAALTLTMLGYVAKRWNKPQFAEKRLTWWQQIKRWYADYKLRKQMERGEK